MKLNIFDIDDTLCIDSGTISKKTIYALELISKKELVWFASARSYTSTLDGIRKSKILISQSIFCTQNGGVIYQNNEIFKVSYLSLIEKIKIIEYIISYENNIKLIDFWIDEVLYTFKTNNCILPAYEEKYRKYYSVDKLVQIFKNTIKISMIHIKTNDITKISSELNAQYCENEINITPQNVDKSNIIELIPLVVSEINVFGNGANDLPLFQKNSYIQKYNYCVGGNKNLLDLSVHNFKDFKMLGKYLQNRYN